MPYKIRSQFIAPKGSTFVACDLSQAETWVVSHLANEPLMINALKNSDIHALTASAIYHSDNKHNHEVFKSNESGLKQCQGCGLIILSTERYIGKKCNHGFSYRMGPERATQSINSESDNPPYITVSLPETKRNRETWLSLYPGIKNWWRAIEDNLKNNNRTITTTYGRSRTFFGRFGDEMYKEATAYEPQSTVADHGTGVIHPDLGITGGLIGIYEDPIIRKYAKLVQTAYDSVMVECPIESAEEVCLIVTKNFGRPLIVNGYEFTIPVDAEYGDRYGELINTPKNWISR